MENNIVPFNFQRNNLMEYIQDGIVSIPHDFVGALNNIFPENAVCDPLVDGFCNSINRFDFSKMFLANCKNNADGFLLVLDNIRYQLTEGTGAELLNIFVQKNGISPQGIRKIVLSPNTNPLTKLHTLMYLALGRKNPVNQHNAICDDNQNNNQLVVSSNENESIVKELCTLFDQYESALDKSNLGVDMIYKQIGMKLAIATVAIQKGGISFDSAIELFKRSNNKFCKQIPMFLEAYLRNNKLNGNNMAQLMTVLGDDIFDDQKIQYIHAFVAINNCSLLELENILLAADLKNPYFNLSSG